MHALRVLRHLWRLSVDFTKDIGVQSYCFRNFKDNREVAALVRRCGLNKIELCGVHCDFATESPAWKDAVNIYRDAGVDIVSMGVQYLSGDAKERKFFDFARLAGVKYMSVSFSVDSVPAAFRSAEKLAEEYDIRLAIHNHGGKDWLGSAAMLANVFKNTSPRVGLCLDTAWMIDTGEDPVAVAEKFAGRLFGLHLKDFIYDRARRFSDVVVGTGNLDLKALRNTLTKIGFAGYAVLEYEADPENPAPAIEKCAIAVREQMK